MIRIDNASDCCGCTACSSICMHDAITMKPDRMGFLYPVVDMDKCVDCGLCDSVCAFNDKYEIPLNFSEPVAFGARHNDMNEVISSRSGAAFVALADFVIENEGIVYGAGFVDHFRVAHKRVTSKEQLRELKGSKYVQSDLTDIFRQVKHDLRNGKTVLFSGTGCQTAGLSSFVGNKLRENLYLVDIVCYGVPSPYVWRDYINYVETEKGEKILGVRFRDKERFGWRAHKESFRFSEGWIPRGTYADLFHSNMILRKSCGNCHFCNLRRTGDITLADFWGWEKSNPTANADNKGLSLVLCNTQRGLDLFECVKNQMSFFCADLENVLQSHLKKPSKLDTRRIDRFTEYYGKNGFEKTIRHFHFIGFRHSLKTWFKRAKCFSLKVLNKLANQ